MMRNMKAVACAAALVCGLYAEASVITNWVYVVTNVYTREVVVITNKVKNTHTNYYYTNHVSTVSNHYDVTYKTNVSINVDVSQSCVNEAANAASNALLSAIDSAASATAAGLSASAADGAASRAEASEASVSSAASIGLQRINERINWFDQHSGETITQVTVSTNVVINKNKVVEIDADGNVWEVGQSDLSQYGAPTTILATGYSGNVIKLMGIAKAVLYVPELDQTTEMFFYAYEGDADFQYYSTGKRVPYVGNDSSTLSVTILYNANTGKWETYGFVGDHFRTGRQDKDSIFVSGETVANYTLAASSEFVGKYFGATRFYVGRVVVEDDLAAVAKTGSYDDLLNKPTYAAVASSGSYNDLLDKPEQSSSEKMLHRVQSPLHRRYYIAFYHKYTDSSGEPRESLWDGIQIQTDRFSRSGQITYELITGPVRMMSATVVKSSGGIGVFFRDLKNISRQLYITGQLDVNDELSMPALGSKSIDKEFYLKDKISPVTGYVKINSITDLERTWSVDYYISSDFNVYDSSSNKIGRLMRDSDLNAFSNWVERTFMVK